jgi:hypothetical protein
MRNNARDDDRSSPPDAPWVPSWDEPDAGAWNAPEARDTWDTGDHPGAWDRSGIAGSGDQADQAGRWGRGGGFSLRDGAGPTVGEGTLLDAAGPALRDGYELRRWWESKDVSGSYAERFDLARTFNRPDRAYGFFDEALIGGRLLPVMGLVQEMLYDRPKGGDPRRTKEQLREFVLRYFMRVSDYRDPEGFPEPPRVSAATVIRGLSWCPDVEVLRRGFGFSQLYALRTGADAPEPIPERSRYAIIDLRDVVRSYEWLLGRVQIFDFNLRYQPFGPSGPMVLLPLNEVNHIVISKDFITDRESPAPGVLGEYGTGYGLIRYVERETSLNYGPGLFDAGFQLINFRVLDGGEVRVRLTFVVSRPGTILNVRVRPVRWGIEAADVLSFGLASRLLGPFRRALETSGADAAAPGFDPITAYVQLANLLTGGRAADDFCVSREQLERSFLTQHFMQHYRMIVGSLLTWRRVPNWLDPEGIPHWAVTGVTS